MRRLKLGRPFEQSSMAYFVYGTLRPGMGNDHRWRGFNATALFDGHAYVRGFQMIDHGIPYAVWTDNVEDLVVGALIVPPDDIDDRIDLRRSMDALEGYPDHYNRAKIVARTPKGPRLAWIYTPTAWKPDGRVEMTGDFHNCGFGLRRKEWGDELLQR